MKKPGWRLILALLLVVLAAWFTFTLPDVPTRVVAAEVVSFEDGEGDWRTITVKFGDGSIQRVETLVPYYVEAGYTVHVAVFERLLLPDHYDIVHGPSTQTNP